MDWQTYVRNLAQKGPRPLEVPSAPAASLSPAQAADQPVAAPPQASPPRSPADGRVFYLPGELVRDEARWLSSEEEWRFNGKDRQGAAPTPGQRQALLLRLLDPFVNETEAMTLLLCPKNRLRDAVNQGALGMFRNLDGQRFFRLSQVLALAEKWEKEKRKKP